MIQQAQQSYGTPKVSDPTPEEIAVLKAELRGKHLVAMLRGDKPHPCRKTPGVIIKCELCKREMEKRNRRHRFCRRCRNAAVTMRARLRKLARRAGNAST